MPRSACATCSSSSSDPAATVSSWWEQTISPAAEPRGAASKSPRSPGGTTTQAVEPLLLPPSLNIVPLLPTAQPSSPVSDRGAAAHSKEPSSSGSGTLEGAVGGVAPAAAPVPSTSFFSETTSIMNELPPQMFGLSEWGDDADILAQVIAQSQHEYLASLKKKSNTTAAAASSQVRADVPSPRSPTENQSRDDKGTAAASDKGKSLMPKDRRP